MHVWPAQGLITMLLMQVEFEPPKGSEKLIPRFQDIALAIHERAALMNLQSTGSNSLRIARVSIIATSLLPFASVRAALRLPALFSDRLVLQAGKQDAVWGWADPGDQVQVTLLDASNSKTLAEATATAGADGHWMTHLRRLIPGRRACLKSKRRKERRNPLLMF